MHCPLDLPAGLPAKIAFPPAFGLSTNSRRPLFEGVDLIGRACRVWGPQNLRFAVKFLIFGANVRGTRFERSKRRAGPLRVVGRGARQDDDCPAAFLCASGRRQSVSSALAEAWQSGPRVFLPLIWQLRETRPLGTNRRFFPVPVLAACLGGQRDGTCYHCAAPPRLEQVFSIGELFALSEGERGSAGRHHQGCCVRLPLSAIF